MTGFPVSHVEVGLAAYAMERQNGFERHQRQNAPPWADARRFWIDAVLQGMARLEGREPDPRQMERFDHQMERRAVAPPPSRPRISCGEIPSVR